MGAEDKDFLEAEWPEGERRIDLIARLLMVYASCDDDEDYLMMQWTMRPDGITAVKSAAASGASANDISTATQGDGAAVRSGVSGASAAVRSVAASGVSDAVRSAATSGASAAE